MKLLAEIAIEETESAANDSVAAACDAKLAFVAARGQPHDHDHGGNNEYGESEGRRRRVATGWLRQ